MELPHLTLKDLMQKIKMIYAFQSLWRRDQLIYKLGLWKTKCPLLTRFANYYKIKNEQINKKTTYTHNCDFTVNN